MNRAGRLEELLATLLRYGTWLATAAIGLGLALVFIGSSIRIASVGIVLFILLPVLRVLLMLLVFLGERDFRLASIAGLVLAIILLGVVLGFHATSGI